MAGQLKRFSKELMKAQVRMGNSSIIYIYNIFFWEIWQSYPGMMQNVVSQATNDENLNATSVEHTCYVWLMMSEGPFQASKTHFIPSV